MRSEYRWDSFTTSSIFCDINFVVSVPGSFVVDRRSSIVDRKLILVNR